MVDRWIVFGGWATSPLVLAPLFGESAEFIDLEDLMPLLVKDGLLAPDWEALVAGQVKKLSAGRSCGLAGWSTGSLLAFAAANRLTPQAAVFLSATPSFCRKQGFPFGQKSAILRAMRERLSVDPKDVLAKFYEQCGMPLPQNELADKGTKSPLIDGLHFLEQASVLPVTPLSCPSLFMHGREDVIVPFQAGMRFCEDAGGCFTEYDGGHAFFMGREEEVAGDIKKFTK